MSARPVLLLASLLALAGTACASSEALRPAPAPRPTLAEWSHARARLAELRASALGEAGPRTLRLRVGLRSPLGGAWMEARGAAAVAPPDALRMILVGPGGTTALDLWMHGVVSRVAVPAANLVHRSDRPSALTPRGLPFDFLRGWLLRPLAGTLLWYGESPDAERFVLRDGDAIVSLVARAGGAVSLRRETWAGCVAGASEACHRSELETVEATALGCAKARYEQQSTGLAVEVTCEGIEPRPPNPRAFDDPDPATKEAP